MSRLSLALLFCMVSATISYADNSQLQATIKAKYPGTNITDVRKSEIPGIYEVIMGQNVGYTDENARFMIFGHLYDLQQQHDLTADRLRSMRRVDTSKLPLNAAVRHTQGTTGNTVLYVFTDPECPYCRKLDAELASMQNVTLYFFLIPTHKSSLDIIAKVYCASRPYDVLHAYMSEGIPVPDPDRPDGGGCSANAATSQQIASTFGITSTPTIVSQDGRVLTGFAPISEVTAWLGKVDSK